jgi:esterase
MELHHKIYGSGEPVIILHGIFGMLDNWHNFATKLSSHFQVITVDQRNHGRSGHSDEFNYVLMCEDLIELVKKLNLDKINLIGHSMGGKTAMNFALKYPEIIKNLIVIDIGIKKYRKSHEFIFEAINEIKLEKMNSRTGIEIFLHQYIPNDAIVKFLMKNISRQNDDNKFIWKMNFKALEQNYDHIISEVKSPNQFIGSTLFVKGANSDYLHEDELLKIRKIFPNAQMNIIDGAGHWIHAEKENELLTVSTNFLNKLN